MDRSNLLNWPLWDCYLTLTMTMETIKKPCIFTERKTLEQSITISRKKQ